VRREPDPEDGRAVRVGLTGEGRRIVDGFHADTSRRIEAVVAELDDPDRERLMGLLGRVVLANRVPVVFLEPDEPQVEVRNSSA
jgi:DNA-binding MarR family transcriptional regulator